MCRRHKVSSRNINFNFKIVVLHVSPKTDRFQSLYDIWGKKQIQTGTCIICLCGTVAFEGQISMKALGPSARIPCRGTTDQNMSTNLSMDLAQMLCQTGETLKDTQTQMRSRKILPYFPLLNFNISSRKSMFSSA